MQQFNHLSAWVQKNHDVCLLGAFVTLPASVFYLSPFVSAVLYLTWFCLVTGLTLYAKVHLQTTDRVAPTGKLWLFLFTTCMASLMLSSGFKVAAVPALAIQSPILFFGVLWDRYLRFKMAHKRIAKRRLQQSRWRLSKRAVLMEWKERLRWLAGIQHDMRQPLHAMGLLLKHPCLQNDVKVGEVTSQLVSCQKWLHDLAENTLEATRFELGEQREYAIKTVSGSEFCEGLAQWIAQLALSKGLDFVVQADDYAIRTDVRRLKRVLSNLLFNAVEHTFEGKVEFTYRRQGGIHRFAVSDSGPGFDSSIFKNSVPSQKVFGFSDLPKTGIGLYVVKRLCQEMSWNLSSEVHPGEGTTFILELADQLGKTRDVDDEKSENASASFN